MFTNNNSTENANSLSIWNTSSRNVSQKPGMHPRSQIPFCLDKYELLAFRAQCSNVSKINADMS
jgi:hypothetical protein